MTRRASSTSEDLEADPARAAAEYRRIRRYSIAVESLAVLAGVAAIAFGFWQGQHKPASLGGFWINLGVSVGTALILVGIVLRVERAIEARLDATRAAVAAVQDLFGALLDDLAARLEDLSMRTAGHAQQWAEPTKRPPTSEPQPPRLGEWLDRTVASVASEIASWIAPMTAAFHSCLRWSRSRARSLGLLAAGARVARLLMSRPARWIALAAAAAAAAVVAIAILHLPQEFGSDGDDAGSAGIETSVRGSADVSSTSTPASAPPPSAGPGSTNSPLAGPTSHPPIVVHPSPARLGATAGLKHFVFSRGEGGGVRACKPLYDSIPGVLARIRCRNFGNKTTYSLLASSGAARNYFRHLVSGSHPLGGNWASSEGGCESRWVEWNRTDAQGRYANGDIAFRHLGGTALLIWDYVQRPVVSLAEGSVGNRPQLCRAWWYNG